MKVLSVQNQPQGPWGIRKTYAQLVPSKCHLRYSVNFVELLYIKKVGQEVVWLKVTKVSKLLFVHWSVAYLYGQEHKMKEIYVQSQI
jgi:hypothetical protein